MVKETPSQCVPLCLSPLSSQMSVIWTNRERTGTLAPAVSVENEKSACKGATSSHPTAVARTECLPSMHIAIDLMPSTRKGTAPQQTWLIWHFTSLRLTSGDKARNRGTRRPTGQWSPRLDTKVGQCPSFKRPNIQKQIFSRLNETEKTL